MDPATTVPKPIGVLIPTRNSAPLIQGHLQSLAPLLDTVEEIVVVDSDSRDGTVEIIQAQLRHPNLRVFQHPPGLYQSWNFGIGQIHAPYVYIATVGDSITREGLLRLLGVAERFKCDAVVSKPRFVDNEGRPAADTPWPIDDVIGALNIREPQLLQGIKLALFAITNITGALLGSSASNLYRTGCLKQRPFPTNFGTSGDGAWGIANALDFRLGITPERFSTFRLHPKSYSHAEYAVDDINWRYYELACATFAPRSPANERFCDEAARWRVRELLELMRQHLEWHRRLEIERGRKLPWIFNPVAWRARARRKYFLNLARARREAVLQSPGLV
jgi:glycosyltransferase involved in cell wall biosynthesis